MVRKNQPSALLALTALPTRGQRTLVCPYFLYRVKNALLIDVATCVWPVYPNHTMTATRSAEQTVTRMNHDALPGPCRLKPADGHQLLYSDLVSSHPIDIPFDSYVPLSLLHWIEGIS